MNICSTHGKLYIVLELYNSEKQIFFQASSLMCLILILAYVHIFMERTNIFRAARFLSSLANSLAHLFCFFLYSRSRVTLKNCRKPIHPMNEPFSNMSEVTWISRKFQFCGTNCKTIFEIFCNPFYFPTHSNIHIWRT